MASRKGKPNKMTAQIKENVIAVFNRLGGTAAMAEWAKENQTDFYRMYASMAPREMSADVHVTTIHQLSDDELIAIALGSGGNDSDAPESAQEPAELH